MFDAIDHIGVAVEDLEGAVTLYSDTFGMPVQHRETVDEQGVEAVLLGVGDSHVELLAPLGDDTPVGKFLAKKGPGLHHTAYRCADVRRAIERLRAQEIEAVAVCFLHSYANPAHERRTGELLRDGVPGRFVSLSVDVLPQKREYERTSTTVINAYVGPPVRRFVDELTPALVRLSPRVAERDVAVEAFDVVASFVDADERHTDDEVSEVIVSFAPWLDHLAVGQPDRRHVPDGVHVLVLRPERPRVDVDEPGQPEER